MSDNQNSHAITVFDKLDEDQIAKADEKVKQAMVYETKIGNETKREITFVGLKWIMLEMAHRGQPLEVVKSEARLDKDDPEDKSTWVWRADVVNKNKTTNHEAEGHSECFYLERKKEYKDGNWTGQYLVGNYDPFGRTKALSKAERNAWRKQIPELRIIELLKAATGEAVQEVDTENSTKSTNPLDQTCDCKESKPNPTLKSQCITCKKTIKK